MFSFFQISAWPKWLKQSSGITYKLIFGWIPTHSVYLIKRCINFGSSLELCLLFSFVIWYCPLPRIYSFVWQYLRRYCILYHFCNLSIVIDIYHYSMPPSLWLRGHFLSRPFPGLTSLRRPKSFEGCFWQQRAYGDCRFNMQFRLPSPHLPTPLHFRARTAIDMFIMLWLLLPSFTVMSNYVAFTQE